MQKTYERYTPATPSIRIMVDYAVARKCAEYVRLASGEISALGLVEEEYDPKTKQLTVLRITDIFLLKQVCDSSETELDKTAVAELLTELVKKGVDIGKLRFWWHSHGDLSVFWSDQDEKCIDGQNNGSYLLSMVTNKRGDSLMRLDQFFPSHLFLTSVVYSIDYPVIPGLAEDCRKEYDAKVSNRTIVLSHGWRGADRLKSNWKREMRRNSIREAARKDSISTSRELYKDELKAALDRGAITQEDYDSEMLMLGDRVFPDEVEDTEMLDSLTADTVEEIEADDLEEFEYDYPIS